MNEKDIRHLLFSLKIPHAKVSYTGSAKRTRWMTISCPFAPWTHARKTDSNPSFGITIKDDKPSAYKCLACGVHGRLSGLPTRLGGYRKLDHSRLRQWAELVEMQSASSRPVPKWEDADPVAIDYSETDHKELPDPRVRGDYPMALGISYLTKRGISYAETMQLDLRYDPAQQRILFPVYNPQDEFVGFTGRKALDKEWTKSDPKVRDYHGLNKREVFLKLPGRRDGKKIICEGLFDFATAVRFGYRNARAILGTALTPEKIEILIAEGEPVYFFMDNDIAGWQALFGIFDKDENLETKNAWAFQLYKEIPVWIVPYRTNLKGEDPGSIPDKETYDSYIKRAWIFTGKAPLNPDGSPSFLKPKIR